MRDKETGLTPKEAAVDIAAGWISAAAEGRTGDLAQQPEGRFREEVRRHLIKMHDKLAASPAGQNAGLMELDG